jgi:phage gp29-like protein
MAELTKLEAKLAEVIGLAMAAQDATQKIEKLVEDQALTRELQAMREEAAEAEERATEVASELEGKKTAVLDEARSVKQKAAEMLRDYLDEDADGLDGFEFLTMAEAGEVGHWSVLEALSKKAGNRELIELARWQLPIQQRHFQTVEQGTLTLAAEEDPNEPA